MTVKLCKLSLSSLIMRYYLMMAVVIIAGFSGIWAIGLLSLPIFISTILGMQFTRNPENLRSQAKVASLPLDNQRKKAS